MAKVACIYICSAKGSPMESILFAQTLKGAGIKGDRYSTGEGSWNQGRPGKRQVSFINIASFKGTQFVPADSRRNVVTEGIELMTLVGKEFLVGRVRFKGVKYCTPCDRPDVLSRKTSFQKTFSERGGLLAEVLDDGFISVGDTILELVA